MASHTRTVNSSSGRRAAGTSGRRAAGASGRTATGTQAGAATGTRTGGTSATNGYSAQRNSGSRRGRGANPPEGTHRGGGTHRSPGSKGPKAKGRKKHLILKWTLGIIGLFLAVGIGAFAYLYATIEIPQPETIALAEKTSVYYADGKTKIGTFAEQNREIIDCSVLPKYVGQAVVASENRTFYTDRGIDLKGIARALINNVTKGTRQGGSTITQQYAERYYLGETTTYMGKLKEAILAVKIAQTQDKDTVLCNYLNTIYLGRSAYGIQAAAQAYFGKDAKDLTVPEAAMLAGIIPSPSNWDPAVNAKQAKSRFERVINIMKEDGYITAKQAREATMPETVTNAQQNIYEGPNGYLLQMVRSELINSKAFTQDDLDTGGYTIVTTIDKSKQDLMYQTASPTKGNAGMPDGVQTGGLSVNVKDGSIISLYAGEDYLKKQLNNVTDATYEVGSTMKPFTLLSTVQTGVSLDTVFNGNSPRSFPGLKQPMSNSGGASYGYINLYKATANSVNTVYMDLQQHLGADTIIKTAHTAGIKGKITDEHDRHGARLLHHRQPGQEADAAHRRQREEQQGAGTVQGAIHRGAGVRRERHRTGGQGDGRHHPIRYRSCGERDRQDDGGQVRHGKRQQGRELHRVHALDAHHVRHLESRSERRGAGTADHQRVLQGHGISGRAVHQLHVEGAGERGGREVPRRDRQRQDRWTRRHVGHRFAVLVLGQQRPVAEREFAGRQQERRPVVAERHAVWRRVGLAVDEAADRQRFEWQRQWIGRQRVRWQRRERRQQRE